MGGGAFAGKVVVITGAGSGIGRATALEFGRLGARVHAADVDAASAQAVVRELEAGVAHRVDVADAAAVEALAADVFAAEGAVDVLHNNAGIGHAGAVADTPLEDWQRVIAVNLMGVVHGVHAFVPRMLRQGRPGHIVNTASLAGLLPAPGMVPYSTTKAAVVGLSEALDAELAPHGIRVTALCPGLVDTPIVDKAILRGAVVERRERIRRLYRRRGARPEAVARATVEAVRRGRTIQLVPRGQVAPLWGLKRVSPRASRAAVRLLERVLG